MTHRGDMQEVTQHDLVRRCWRLGFTVKRTAHWLNHRHGSMVGTDEVWRILRFLRKRKRVKPLPAKVFDADIEN
jgi:hypothetical protein